MVRTGLHRRSVGVRRGSAIVELAVTLPILVLIVLGTIEATSMIFLKQSLEICAYEGARVALLPGSQQENVVAGCNQMLAIRKVEDASVTVTPSDIENADYGTPIQVRISASCASNSLFSPWFYAGRQSVAEVVMMKE